MKVYLDNAATTPLSSEVIEAMTAVMQKTFGNPSSVHNYGRESKALVEQSRKQIASYFNASPGEIFFTSGGTESDNIAIRGAIEDLGIKHAITSKIEHPAVLMSLETLAGKGKIKLEYVRLKEDGHIDLKNLEELLSDNKGLNNERSFVSLMHANNEIGNLLPLKRAAELCRSYDAIFHSDTVQTVGHYNIDLSKIPVHFIACSAHKFHGPKGMGFLYINGNIKISPLFHGGSQERNMRGGTENVYGIAGLARALELAHHNMESQQNYIQCLKSYMINQLEQQIPGIEFNGDAKGSSLYTVLNVLLPETAKKEMLVHYLDISGIAVSAGSACGSGSSRGSHVLQEIGVNTHRPSLRFSFSKYNTREEIDYCISKLREIYI